jgi:hypothetical protein
MRVLAMSHTNDGNCLQCRKIVGKFPGFYQPLAIWFFQFQKDHPEAHCSEAGRDEMTQEAYFQRRASRARWKQSAHNWNAGLDLFEMQGDRKNIYEEQWFEKVLRPNLPDWIEWYGRPGAPFREFPHIEAKDWKALAKAGTLKLVGEDEHA